jgi:hypothetical protein
MAVLAALLVFPASAIADTDPRDELPGVPAGADWFEGSIIQQPGQNCSVLGNPYTEIMINGNGSYGGRNGVVKVGDEYWTGILIGVPGNPCGSGSSSVATDLKLPKNTAYDPTRPIKCYGTNRFSDNFFDITNQSWNFLGQTGPYCPSGPSAGSASGIGQGYGFRPLANGQLFWMFVPVKSTGVVNGAGEPGETGEFNWLSTASAAYANPYRSYTWANIFPASPSSGPQVYFARTPSAVPFWNESTPGTENRVEFFANLYTAGTGMGNSGTYLGYEIRRDSDNLLIAKDDCTGPPCDPGWNGTVPSSPDLLQVYGTPPGPNGGYVPFAYGGYENTPMTITWDYCYNSCLQHVYGSQKFRTLSGPDLDHDGIGDNADACPGVQGNLPNGCLTTPKMDGSTSVKRGAKIKRSGQSIGIDCNLLATATAKLTIKRGLARNLGVISAAGVRIGGGSAQCKPAADNKLRLKLTPKAKRKLRRPGRERATLSITFKQGSKTDRVVVPVKIA